MSFEKPDDVRKAQKEGDSEALSRMGKKGAKKAAESKFIKKTLKEIDEQETLMTAQYQELLHEHGEERAKQILKDQE